MKATTWGFREVGTVFGRGLCEESILSWRNRRDTGPCGTPFDPAPITYTSHKIFWKNRTLRVLWRTCQAKGLDLLQFFWIYDNFSFRTLLEKREHMSLPADRPRNDGCRAA